MLCPLWLRLQVRTWTSWLPSSLGFTRLSPYLNLSMNCATPRSLAFGILRKPGEDSRSSSANICSCIARRTPHAMHMQCECRSRRYDPYWAKRVCVATGAECISRSDRGLEALAVLRRLHFLASFYSTDAT